MVARVSDHRIHNIVCIFPYVVYFNQPSTLHGCQDIVLKRFWGRDVDLFGSRDIIGCMTIGLAI